MSEVWLVTDSASGLGRNITEAVLASRARLVATALDRRYLEDPPGAFAHSDWQALIINKTGGKQ